MNRKEWKKCADKNVKYYFMNKTRYYLKSGIFSSNPLTDENATVIHHLRDTEEQRKYNDEHYELWGFEIDENGNEHFEYGKYVVFWTKEHHDKYHHLSIETREKLRIANLGSNNHFYGKKHSSETKLKISISQKRRFINRENHPMYGKHHTEESRKKMGRRNVPLSDEHKLKISNSMKAIITDDFRQEKSTQFKTLWQNDDYRNKQIDRMSGENNHNFGKHLSDETIKKLSDAMSGENHPNYGKHLSDETKKKIGKANSIALSGKHLSDETKKKMSNTRVGHKVSENTRLKISNDKKLKSLAFSHYKDNGGDLSWNDFQKAIKNGFIDMYIYL